MSVQREEKKMKQKMESTCQILTWQEKKELADEEGQALEKEVEELVKWTNMIEDMNDEQLKDYLNQRPDSLKTLIMEKIGNTKRVQRVKKPKRCSSSIIMSAVRKFCKEDGHEESSVEVNTQK